VVFEPSSCAVLGTPHPNAYQSGFSIGAHVGLDSSLIVRQDTPSGGAYSQGEVLAILAHELGHWKHSHVIKLFVITLVSTCCRSA
jgi:Zn-dependent protease with chaperone function